MIRSPSLSIWGNSTGQKRFDGFNFAETPKILFVIPRYITFAITMKFVVKTMEVRFLRL